MTSNWRAVLRCQTWNVWPEESGDPGVTINPVNLYVDVGATVPLEVTLTLHPYAQRLNPENYLDDETHHGPVLWDGDFPGRHRVWDSFFKTPGTYFPTNIKHRHACRGEVDICITFQAENELTDYVEARLRGIALSVMAWINLKMGDYLVPQMPFQVRELLPDGNESASLPFRLTTERRKILSVISIDDCLSALPELVPTSAYGERYAVALELYAAHFSEQNVTVRFLLLVIAIESLAVATVKNPVALDLVARWQAEINAEELKYDEGSEEYQSLQELSRELGFRSADSVRATIRKLFLNLPGIEPDEAISLKRRALSVYDKRSVLVHQGHLPTEELFDLEIEARRLLKAVFECTLGLNS